MRTRKTYPNLYRAIRDDARQWWYHAQLRQQGQVEEARKREIKSTRETIRNLRRAKEAGGYLTLNRLGGATLHVDQDVSVSGLHDGCRWVAKQTLRTIRLDGTSYEQVLAFLRLPLIVTDDDPREPEPGFFGLQKLDQARPALAELGIRVDDAIRGFAPVALEVNHV